MCVREQYTSYIYIFKPRGGDPFTCYCVHDDVVVSDSQHVSRSGLRRDRRQRVKTPITTLSKPVPRKFLDASVCIKKKFFYHIFARAASKPETKNDTEIRHETDATTRII